jgi:hypothetical protein
MKTQRRSGAETQGLEREMESMEWILEPSEEQPNLHRRDGKSTEKAGLERLRSGITPRPKVALG